jgi:hypothetical protein
MIAIRRPGRSETRGFWGTYCIGLERNISSIHMTVSVLRCITTFKGVIKTTHQIKYEVIIENTTNKRKFDIRSDRPVCRALMQGTRDRLGLGKSSTRNTLADHRKAFLFSGQVTGIYILSMKNKTYTLQRYKS